MAFQINPRIPLEALANPINIGDSFAKAQENQLRLQALRDEYNAAKEEKLRQKQMRSGIQTDIEQIQRGIPAQYSPLQYQQTPQTGQMPYGMTGVLANERGQNMPQPSAFGEDILAGNFNLNREMVAPAQQGRQPTPEEYVQILAKQAMLYGDEAKGFEALKLAAELKERGLEKFLYLTRVNFSSIEFLLRAGLINLDDIQTPDFYCLKIWDRIKSRYEKEPVAD